MSRYKQYINENINTRNYTRQNVQAVADIVYDLIQDKMTRDLGLNPPPLVKAAYVCRPTQVSENMKTFINASLNILNETTTSSDVSSTTTYKGKSVEIINRLQQLDNEDDAEKRFNDVLGKILLKIASSASSNTTRKYTHHLERLLKTML